MDNRESPGTPDTTSITYDPYEGVWIIWSDLPEDVNDLPVVIPA